MHIQQSGAFQIGLGAMQNYCQWQYNDWSTSYCETLSQCVSEIIITYNADLSDFSYSRNVQYLVSSEVLEKKTLVLYMYLLMLVLLWFAINKILSSVKKNAKQVFPLKGFFDYFSVANPKQTYCKRQVYIYIIIIIIIYMYVSVCHSVQNYNGRCHQLQELRATMVCTCTTVHFLYNANCQGTIVIKFKMQHLQYLD